MKLALRRTDSPTLFGRLFNAALTGGEAVRVEGTVMQQETK